MLIYLLCGVFLGVLIGSWGAYLLFGHAEKPIVEDVPLATFSTSADEPTAEAEAARIQADREMKALTDGVKNLLMYTGKPTKESGDAK